MSSIFDTQKGILRINNEIFMEKDMFLEDFFRKGINFIDEEDMENGWKWTSFKENFLGETFFNLSFYENKLKKIYFSICSREDTPFKYKNIFERQNSFLRKELGEPDESNNMHVLYRYPWGHISSTVDLKNMSSSIYMSWD